MSANDAADIVFLDLAVRLLKAAQDGEQGTADKIFATTDLLEWAYPGVRNRVREKSGLPPVNSPTQSTSKEARE